MGMAASQARLLTLTSRLHDIEYKAHNIESQKIALATQKDELYQKYCDALDATKIQVAFNNGDGTRKFIDANFSTVCGYDANRFQQYSLTNTRTGKVIVDEHTAEIYDSFDRDKYAFAMAMLGLDCNFGWSADRQEEGNCIGIGTGQDMDFGYGYGPNGQPNLYMTEVERKVFDNHQDDTKLVESFEKIDEAETTQDKKIALDSFRDLLYKSYSKEIYNYQRLNKQDFNNTSLEDGAEFDTDKEWGACEDEFNYYIHLFEQIQSAGGCEVVDPQYVSGDSANEWFNNMVNAGMAVISTYDADKKEWTETSVATSTNQNYLQEAQDDKDLKKAEAEYEHELSIINRKDTKFDKDLSKLETERTAITTEMDAIKKVKDDNIDRTFGIFS